MSPATSEALPVAALWNRALAHQSLPTNVIIAATATGPVAHAPAMRTRPTSDVVVLVAMRGCTPAP